MDKSKHILFIHNFAISYRLPLFKRLDEHFNVTFCFTRERCKTMATKGLPSKYEMLNLGMNIFFLKDLFRYVNMFYTKIYGVIISGDPCTFETQLAFIMSKLLKKHFVLFSEEWIAGTSLKRSLASPILNFIVKHSDACIVPSFRHKNHLVSMGSSSDKIFIAPNASYTGNFQIDNEKVIKMRDSLGIHNKKVIMSVGRIVEFKGLEYLLRAFKIMDAESSDAFLLIGGTGINESKMKKLSEQLSIKNIYFYGWLDEETKKLFFEMADVFVLPSIYHKGAEPWGLVLNEAMHHGKPVITTNMVGAAYSLVKDSVNGYVVKEKDVDELYNAMKKIISNSDLKQQMGIKSKEIIDSEFNYENQTQGFVNAILKIADK